jgi:hypothetical protein
LKILDFETFLFEDARDDYILQQQGEKLVQAAQRDNSARGLDAPAILSRIREMDPTNGKFMQYLVSQYIKPDEEGNQKYRLEDTEQVKTSLDGFMKMKQQLNVSDINQYKNIQDLFTAIYELQQKNAPVAKTKGEEEREKFEGAKVLYHEPGIVIYDLTTPESARAVALKYQTRWCTLNTDTARGYINQGGLYAILVKKDGKVMPFQMHYESDQVMNAADSPVNKKEKEALSSFAVWYKFIDWLIGRHYYDKTEIEKEKEKQKSAPKKKAKAKAKAKKKSSTAR